MDAGGLSPGDPFLAGSCCLLRHGRGEEDAISGHGLRPVCALSHYSAVLVL